MCNINPAKGWRDKEYAHNLWLFVRLADLCFTGGFISDEISNAT